MVAVVSAWNRCIFEIFERMQNESLGSIGCGAKSKEASDWSCLGVLENGRGRNTIKHLFFIFFFTFVGGEWHSHFQNWWENVSVARAEFIIWFDNDFWLVISLLMGFRGHKLITETISYPFVFVLSDTIGALWCNVAHSTFSDLDPAFKNGRGRISLEPMYFWNFRTNE